MANVLIIDDDKPQTDALERMLEWAGHHAFVVRDGRTALALLDGLRPDMIVLDAAMPGIDALDLLRTIRRHPAHSNVPVFVYSTHADPETIERALSYGAEEFVVAPRRTSVGRAGEWIRQMTNEQVEMTN
jgi:PleD family two-component response regulator